MNYYYGSNGPLSLDWYRLLSIYSDLGKKSISHDEVCDIETELQAFKGDVETAIQGISAKLDALIGSKTKKLSEHDLSELRQTIVDGMKEHVSKSADQCAAPVVCKGESVVFTDDVKEVLESLVVEKARELEKMSENITHVKNQLDEYTQRIERIEKDIASGPPLREADVTALGEMFNGLEESVKSVAKKLEPGLPLNQADADEVNAFFDNTDAILHDIKNTITTEASATRQDALADAIVEKMGLGGNIRTAVENAFGERESFSQKEIQDLATAIASQITNFGANDPLDEETFAQALANFFGGRGKSGAPNTIAPDDDLLKQCKAVEPDNLSLYKKKITNVIKMFKNKDSELYIGEGDRTERCCQHAAYFELEQYDTYTTSTDVSVEQVLDNLCQRYPTRMLGTGISNKKIVQYAGLLELWLKMTPPLLAIDVYRLMHSVCVDDGLDK